MTQHTPGSPPDFRPPTSDLRLGFGREVCGDLESGLRREWLVTNGLGGYASGTLAGVNTRRYHGLLVASLTPPVERTVLVGGVVERAEYDGRAYELSTHEYGGGTITGHGYRHGESFRLDGTLPVWTVALADALVERRLFMPHGANTTYLTYRVLRAARELRLHVTPLVTYRDFHSLTRGHGWQPGVRSTEGGVEVQAWEGARPFRLLSPEGGYTAGGEWYWNFRHREEAARGLDAVSDMYAPGAFTATLAIGQTLTLVFTTEQAVELDATRVLAREQQRQAALIRRARAEDAKPVVRQLVLAADQFIVRRGDPTPGPSPSLRAIERGADPANSTASTPPSSAIEETTPTTTRTPDCSPLSVPASREGEGQGVGSFGRTIIAGYHWFNDWGRDTMIALPGLCLATGRTEDAADILRTFARYVRDGLLPNNFPDASGEIPGYNTVDATLWYIHAIRAYTEATGDQSLVDELLPIMCDVLDWHIRGTHYGIAVDPADGLLHAGEPGVQLTWMDAKISDWVVTPRIGKPVEINALWYNALHTVASFCKERGERAGERYERLSAQTRASFRARFLRADRPYLADVVDGPDGDDWTVRPNQIFAVSLPESLLDGDEARNMVDAVGRALYTSHGLRSLSQDDPRYRGDYGGDQLRRDSAYHQGPVWTWLAGPCAEAHFRVYGDREAALSLLRPFDHHLNDAGLGTISEILEGDAPHLPRGCIAQAWGVAEVLRVWRKLG